MGLHANVSRQVASAFKRIGDLAVPTVFSIKSTATFNFGTGTVDTQTATTKAVLAVEKMSTRRGDSADTYEKEIIVQATDITDAAIYDTVILAGITYKIVHPCTSNGFTTKVRLVR